MTDADSKGWASLIFLGLLIIFCFIVSFWTDRSLDFWLSYLKEAEQNFPFWLSAIFTFLALKLSIMLNIITEILRIFLGE
jgi:hypothetical protein